MSEIISNLDSLCVISKLATMSSNAQGLANIGMKIISKTPEITSEDRHRYKEELKMFIENTQGVITFIEKSEGGVPTLETGIPPQDTPVK